MPSAERRGHCRAAASLQARLGLSEGMIGCTFDVCA
jgi:hypothetical protein